MPFWHNGRYHLYYLLDENHHQGLSGLGGHQWAHASTVDLVHWEHHPLALPVTEPWEGSICTGSTVYHAGQFHAFYATRKRDRTQHLSHAVSRDGLTFTKTEPNPFASPPAGYGPLDYRDPFVFCDGDGRWQMLVTARLADYALPDRGGCLLRLSSADLWDWRIEGPLLIPGGGVGYRSVPECPDYFHWNGWYYLVFGLGLETHYRMARQPWGPWLRPPVATLGNAALAVMKTAPFGEGPSPRRIGAAWIGWRAEDKDTGCLLWGGQAVLRELVQHADGTLGTRFVPELIPPSGAPVPLAADALTRGVTVGVDSVTLDDPESLAVAAFSGLPDDYRLRCRLVPQAPTARFGLGLRGVGRFEGQAALAIHGHLGVVTLGEQRLERVAGLEAPFELDVIVRGDLFDVCIGGARCLINRLPEQRGDKLFFIVENGAVTLEGLRVEPLMEHRK
jgi:hypothetical protein